VSYLYLLKFLPRLTLLALALWYALIVGWALILRRIGQSLSIWDELD
jgi:hypothetical protein